MKYWKVSLLREGRCARQWHVRADVLTVGSHGSNKVRLPPPVEAFALQLSDLVEAKTHEVGPFTLLIEDETTERKELWNVAKFRVEEAVSAASVAPREAPVAIRATIAAFTLVGLTNLAGSLVMDHRPHVLREYERNHPAAASMPRTGRPVETPAPSFEASKPVQASPTVAVAAPFRPGSMLFSTANAGVAKAASIVMVAPNSPVPAAPTGHSWDGVMMAYASGAPETSAMPSQWLSSTPARYRAPWPDAPVPPH